ncbi:hypothetical protein C8J57DRAFT_1719562 [Mycena rebaudengoi]|nr:hypothetical protein C8J57DRAFT_1719562 [Mycena rebaudengoi]
MPAFYPLYLDASSEPESTIDHNCLDLRRLCVEKLARSFSSAPFTSANLLPSRLALSIDVDVAFIFHLDRPTDPRLQLAKPVTQQAMSVRFDDTGDSGVSHPNAEGSLNGDTGLRNAKCGAGRMGQSTIVSLAYVGSARAVEQPGNDADIRALRTARGKSVVRLVVRAVPTCGADVVIYSGGARAARKSSASLEGTNAGSSCGGWRGPPGDGASSRRGGGRRRMGLHAVSSSRDGAMREVGAEFVHVVDINSGGPRTRSVSLEGADEGLGAGRGRMSAKRRCGGRLRCPRSRLGELEVRPLCADFADVSFSAAPAPPRRRRRTLRAGCAFVGPPPGSVEVRAHVEHTHLARAPPNGEDVDAGDKREREGGRAASAWPYRAVRVVDVAYFAAPAPRPPAGHAHHKRGLRLRGAADSKRGGAWTTPLRRRALLARDKGATRRKGARNDGEKEGGARSAEFVLCNGSTAIPSARVGLASPHGLRARGGGWGGSGDRF